MSGFRQPELAREQLVLWSERRDDAIAADHPVRYLHGMLNRLRSSRQLEAAGYHRRDGIWRLRRQHPDPATIAGFVETHGPG